MSNVKLPNKGMMATFDRLRDTREELQEDVAEAAHHEKAANQIAHKAEAKIVDALGVDNMQEAGKLLNTASGYRREIAAAKTGPAMLSFLARRSSMDLGELRGDHHLRTMSAGFGFGLHVIDMVNDSTRDPRTLSDHQISSIASSALDTVSMLTGSRERAQRQVEELIHSYQRALTEQARSQPRVATVRAKLGDLETRYPGLRRAQEEVDKAAPQYGEYKGARDAWLKELSEDMEGFSAAIKAEIYQSLREQGLVDPYEKVSGEVVVD